MRTLELTKVFKRDFKKAKANPRHAKDVRALYLDIVGLLAEDKPLPEHMRDHALVGDWNGYRECHLKPDLLLVYRKTPGILILILNQSASCTFLMWPTVKSPQPHLPAFWRRAGSGREWAANGLVGGRCLPCLSYAFLLSKSLKNSPGFKNQFLIRAVSAKYHSVQRAVCRVAQFDFVAKQQKVPAPLLTRQLPREY